MTTLWNRMTAAYRAFREPQIVVNIADTRDFGDYDNRRTRYGIYFAYYENTVYNAVQQWADAYRTKYGLYKYIRNIYNPTYRLVEFYRTHLWGGQLDPRAGDGKDEPSALPIDTENERLRPAIGKVWEWSNWSTKKDVTSLYGAAMGDVALKVVDDVSRQKVYLEVVHPQRIKDVVLDPQGFVKAYELEELRYDPDNPTIAVTHTERVTREGDNVVYQTYKNGALYPWNGLKAEWKEPYGFVPFVFWPHNDVGMDWGWAEMHPLQPKFREVDDLASKLHDHIRKTVDPIWFITGAEAPDEKKKAAATHGAPTTTDPQPARTELPAMYGPLGAEASAMVADINIPGVTAEIQEVLREIERDFPELQMDIWGSGDQSGKALRTARKRSETKALMRRSAYDQALVRAHQMAVAIGGFRRYGTAFNGFGLDSYQRGDLDHYIGNREVFTNDELDEIEVKQAYFSAIETGTKAGMMLEDVLLRMGESEDDIAQMSERTRVQQRAVSGDAESIRQASRATRENARTAAQTAQNAELNNGTTQE